MKIAHVALWTRNLSAQVRSWETVFGSQQRDLHQQKTAPALRRTLLRHRRPDD